MGHGAGTHRAEMMDRLPRIDVHTHLAGVGTQGSGCWTSPRFRRRPSFLALRWMSGITRQQLKETIDQDWAARLSAFVASSDLDLAVALGFDAVYDSSGVIDLGRSQLIVPHAWVFEVCRRYPNLLPGPSINPTRRDAVDVLDEAIERGAALIKWLPIVQGFDPADRSFRPFLERLAESRVPLLVHAGSGEVTFATIDGTVGDVESLVPALELGVRVICAHGAAPLLASLRPSQVPVLRRMLERYPDLWIDNSGLANPSRARYLPRFADDAVFRSRVLHGSDFPVPTDPVYYPRRLGLAGIVGIERERNPLQRDFVLKRAIGYDEASFTRAWHLLGGLQRTPMGKSGDGISET